MGPSRRAVLAVIATGLPAGCLTGGGEETGTPSPGGSSPEPTSCDPADVSRPPVVQDTDHPPEGYGTKPQELTEQSVGDYLADFETAFAWNRILAEHDPVRSLGVNTTTAWAPEPAGEGFLASSRIETDYTKEESTEPTERTYVANYHVAPGPVYRVETESEAVDPRTHSDRQLVQCGTTTTKPAPESPTDATPTDQGATNAIRYTIRNDDDRPHPLDLTIETPQGTVVHRQTDPEFTPTDLLQGTFVPADVGDGEYPVTISLESLSTTIGWTPTECARFDLLVAITGDGDLDVERQHCAK